MKVSFKDPLKEPNIQSGASPSQDVERGVEIPSGNGGADLSPLVVKEAPLASA